MSFAMTRPNYLDLNRLINLIRLKDLLTMAAGEPPAEPPKNEPPAEPPKNETKGEEIPAWGKQILDLLKQKEPSTTETKTEEIPVPKPPQTNPSGEGDHQKPKKKSFLEWFM